MEKSIVTQASNFFRCEYKFKILLIGDSNVGKTSIFKNFADNITSD